MSVTIAAPKAAENNSNSYGRIQVKRVAPSLGAEISGVDLANLDDETFAEIHDALMAHEVVFFRNQDLPVDKQLELGRRFGEPVYSKKLPKYEGQDYVSLLQSDGSKPNVGGRWHADNTDFEAPPMGAVLYCEQSPSIGGDTMFASMSAAYEAFSEGMKRHLDTLVAQHDNSLVVARFAKTEFKGDDELVSGAPAEHPVVRVHPVSGRKGLFVNSTYTRRILGVPDAESHHLIEMINDHIKNPAFHVRFRWEPGSVAIWDNRATQHFALNDYCEPRRMRRVQIAGDKPFGVS